MKFQAFVFDLDGTLVDSKIDFESMRAELGVTPEQDVLESIAAMSEFDQKRAQEIVHRHEKQGAQASTLIEGAREFVDHARSRGLPCAVFTRNSRETAEWSLTQHGFSFDLMISREDGPAKPDPAGLYSIAAQFKVGTSSMLFVGDYLYDLQAGLRAGVQTALYLPQSADFDTVGAAFIFKHYAQLRGWCFSKDWKSNARTPRS